ncbi:MAG: sel1 repeat family protein [Proteobacteria bacterium]|nr:sel1 repeat family protein [Pseudomonadota bacterium]NOG60080.1 sel1 repeat family protein [Pseudomonadota bacterium]
MEDKDLGEINNVQDAIDIVSQAFSDGEFGKALLLLKPLADQGIAEAIGMLGIAYQRGAGVELDAEKAIELLEKAVDMGDAVAAYNLGLLYQNGMPGVDIDMAVSQRYFQLANEMGANFE